MTVKWSLLGGLVASLSLFTVGCGDDGDPGDGGALDGSAGDAGPARDADGTDAGGDAGEGRPARCGNMMVEGDEECDDGNDSDDDECLGDCTLACGDGVVSSVETCDTAIAEGEPGACPSECDDGVACTTDSRAGADCTVQCEFGPITAAVDGDGCCPEGLDATDDDDCEAVCDNGVVEPGEACDTAIAEGEPGACPTACDDLELCTTDALLDAGTCDARCEFTPITEAADGDMCCPEGESLLTDADCPVACGDGVRSAGEACDTGIAAGAGSCPTACDDGSVCTADALVNPGTCAATCTSTAITDPIDGDGCCPPGETIMTDSDCTATCGDGAVTGGETCDTAIATGMGRCPTACDDGMACTRDVLNGAGTCSASCTFSPITAPADGDGCCPPGETIGTDDDCAATCGDGVVTMAAGETCDTAIASGAGSCPTACDDAMVCTIDTLRNGGTCRAVCEFAPRAAGPMDGCCPMGADLSTDPDCTARCGDRVVTPPETCDDGGTMSGDGCSDTCQLEPVAFRLTDLDIRDPHLYARVIFCLDVTNTAFGMDGVNPLIQASIQTDGDDPADGLLDLSIVQLFDPLEQAAGTSTASYITFPDCTAPMSSTTCTLAAGAERTPGTAMNMGMGAVCLDRIPGTTRMSYTPALVIPTAPGGGTCYVAHTDTISLSLGGIDITLQDASIAGEWFGLPATEIRDGMIRGFISEADADTTIIPEGTTGFDSIDGEPLSSLLRGGTGVCQSGDDRDTLDGESGWYFYLNFSAVRVPYTEL